MVAFALDLDRRAKPKLVVALAVSVASHAIVAAYLFPNFTFNKFTPTANSSTTIKIKLTQQKATLPSKTQEPKAVKHPIDTKKRPQPQKTKHKLLPTKASQPPKAILKEAAAVESKKSTVVEPSSTSASSVLTNNPITNTDNQIALSKNQNLDSKSTLDEVIQTEYQPPSLNAGITNPEPQYPLAAKRRGLQGKVILEVRVSISGTAQSVQIKHSSGYKILDNAAVKTVSLWRFVPATKNGQPLEANVVIPIAFELI